MTAKDEIARQHKEHVDTEMSILEEICAQMEKYYGEYCYSTQRIQIFSLQNAHGAELTVGVGIELKFHSCELRKKARQL